MKKYESPPPSSRAAENDFIRYTCIHRNVIINVITETVVHQRK